MAKRAIYLCMIGSVLFSIMLIMTTIGDPFYKNRFNVPMFFGLSIVVITFCTAIYAIKRKDYKKVETGNGSKKASTLKLGIASYMISTTFTILIIIIELFLFDTNLILSSLTDYGIIFIIFGTLAVMPLVSKYLRN